jgi:hypothetical protein
MLESAGLLDLEGAADVVAGDSLSEPEDDIGDELLRDAPLLGRFLGNEDEVAFVVGRAHDLGYAGAAGRDLAIGVEVADEGFEALHGVEEHEMRGSAFSRRGKEREHAVDEAPVVSGSVGGEVDKADFEDSGLGPFAVDER